MPSDEIVDRAIQIARMGTAEYEYLFENLTSADWLEPLFQRGFFRAPPEAIHDGEYLRFPAWPESRYLARVADQDPAKVLEIARQIPTTANTLVHQDLAQAACKIPGPLASEWIQHELGWISDQRQLYMLLPEELGRLAQHLARSGEVQNALRLTRVVLDVWLPEQNASLTPAFRHPVSRLSSWDYGEFLRLRIPTLLDVAPAETFTLLADLLDQALRIGTNAERDEHGRIEDYTFITRPAIEDHPDQRKEDHPTDLEHALLLALRDAGEVLLANGSIEISDVVGWLEEREPVTFSRLALHFLRTFPGLPGARNLIAARLISPKYFDVVAVHHEYIELLRAQATSLSLDELNQLLNLIDSHSVAQEDQTANEESLEEQETHKQRWLAELEPVLPEERLEELRALEAKYSERRHPDFHVGPTRVGWVGTTSPKSEEELETLTPEDLLNFGKEWQEPAQAFFGETPSYEGLGKALAAVVGKSPGKFASVVKSFATLHPAFSWGYFEGLETVAERDEPFDWEHPLRLAQAISSRIDTDSDRLREPNWNWANRSALRLIEKGLNQQKSKLHSGYRELLWNAIESLTEHPEPTVEYEAEYGGSNMDPLTLSINTIRGVAMNAVIEYALWLHRNGELNDGFSDAPEVAIVLERHLDTEVDPSEAIRSVYGRWIPWLFLMDRQWTRDHVHKIFADSEALGIVAWSTYISWVRPFNDVFPEIREFYAAAIEAMPEHEDDKAGAMHSPNESLASHLIAYYLRDLVGLEQGGVIDRLFAVGSPKTLGFAIEATGRGLSDHSDDDFIRRSMSLWEWRLASNKMTAEELEAFGWWAASSRLDPEWMLANLATVLGTAKKIDAGWLVVERLVDLVDQHGLRTIECLRLMIEGDPDPWSITHWEKDIRQVLSRALASSDPQIRRAAYELTNLLGAKGHFGFADLLRS